MARSYEWTEYHLTPTGWVQGIWKTDFASSGKVDTPADRVKTCRYVEHYTDHLESTVYEEWVGDPAAAAALEVKFGSCPTSL